MKRLKRFVREFFYLEIENKGFCYISDNDIFVLDSLLNIFKYYDVDVKYSSSSIERKNAVNNLLKKIKEGSIFKNNQKEEKDLVLMLEYQMFLEENNYDGRFKRKVRNLITNEILQSYDGIDVKREKYFFKTNAVDINFIDGILNLLPYLNDTHRKDFFYRGHSNLNWKLIPSIYRKDSWIKNEHEMFREIILRNPENFSHTNTALEKLTIMQHYGLPTRLLDVTKNPLVALYFCCSDSEQMNKPGELIILNPDIKSIKYSDSDTVSILANLAKSERNLKIMSKTNFNKTYNPGLKLLHLIKEEKPYFRDNITPTDLEDVLVVKPINNNERIKRQQGCFFLFGFKDEILKPAKIKYLFTKNNKILKLIVEEHQKPFLLKELEVLGISSDSLFPEIDKGAEYIKGRY